MKAASAIGIVLACVMIAVGATMEGSDIMAVLNMPAILIVLGLYFGLRGAGRYGIDALFEKGPQKRRR